MSEQEDVEFAGVAGKPCIGRLILGERGLLLTPPGFPEGYLRRAFCAMPLFS